MALNFPSNPAPGQVYTDPSTGLTYVWNNIIGAFESAEQPPVIVSDTEPSTSVAGKLWFDPSDREFRIFDGVDWIPPGIVNSVIMSETAPTVRPNTQPLESGDLWWDTTSGLLYIYYEDGDSSQWVSSIPTSTIDKIKQGSAVEPSIYFENDENTGIFSNADGSISFTSNGVHKVSINTNGIISVNNTGSWKIPAGTNNQRTTPASEGMIRFNTDSDVFEGFDGSNWVPFSDKQTVSTSPTPPTSPAPSDGDLWFNETTGDFFVYYADGDSSQWIQVGGTSLSTGVLPIESGGTGASNIAEARINLGVISKSGDRFTGNVGIGGSGPVNYPLEVQSNSAIRIPVGNTSDRNNISNPVAGLIRFNSQTNRFEGYNGTSWITFTTS